jgi:NADPH:quinone reductase-like Zn-dependent oxidoreductase
MPQAVWPRTPGRDFAGVVVEGPAGAVGREVWGSSGELGIKRDGSHATHLALDAAWLRDKPTNLSFREAGSVGVPFVTAAQGFAEAGGIASTDVVLVLGANGKVGQAAVQIAARAGARVVAVARGERHGGFASAPVAYIDARGGDIAARFRDLSGGRGADLVFNVAGSPHFDAANRAMAKLGRQIFVSTLDRAVPFDILAFYRGRHRFIGVDSLGLGTAESCALLDALKPGFEDGTLKPFAFAQRAACGLDGMAEAYRAVLAGEAGRVVLEPRS